MYVWVVLATYLAMIAAYVLPIRSDTEKNVVVPVAQAKLVQMSAMQKAGALHIKRNSWPFVSSELEREVTFNNGVVDVSTYLDENKVVNTGEFVTGIYCLTDDQTALRTGADACRKMFEETFLRVLITYGPIPEKWRRYVQDGADYKAVPSNDMMNALRMHYTQYDMAGYAIEKSGQYYIVNYEGTEYEVPTVVAGYGLSECISNNNGSCLAQMDWK